MAHTEDEYNAFLRKQADQYTTYLKSIFKEAAAYHNKRCDSPYPLKPFCTRSFLEHFMEDFSDILARRQKEAVPEMERRERLIKKTEDDILTQMFGPHFNPRNN